MQNEPCKDRALSMSHGKQEKWLEEIHTGPIPMSTSYNCTIHTKLNLIYGLSNEECVMKASPR